MKIKGKQKGYYKVVVYVDDKILGHKASCKVVNHSPTGFQWGYAGSGPTQLALALLLLRTDDETAERLHHEFRSRFISTLPKDENFEIEIDIEQWIIDRGFKVKNRDVGIGELDDEDRGECSFPDRCQKAVCEHCDCACDGKNHKLQARLI